MKYSTTRTLIYGLIGLASMLLSSIGYLYGHKLLLPGALIGVLSAVWQMLLALIVISIAGAIGEYVLGAAEAASLTRFGLAAALGAWVLGLVMLVLGAALGTSAAVFIVAFLILGAVFARRIPAWWNELAELRALLAGGYEKLLALGVFFILAVSLVYSLAPPTEFDALTYHLSLPLAYLQQGHITYLPDTMFWGMPQLVEVLYLPLLRLGASQAASVFILLIGAISLIGLLGFTNSLFGSAAGWTAVVALVIGENLIRALSTAYVDWMSILFGWAAIVSLHHWLERGEQRSLILTGVFCGGALGTKYSAGIILLGVILALDLLHGRRPFRETFASIFIVGIAAVVASSPWWVKNLIGTGNPFYPFFFPSGAMDANRLEFYQNNAPWGDWRSVILLPWQATFWGIDGKEGFSASIGPLLVGLSPVAWIGWRSRTGSQKRSILAATIVTLAGFFFWAVGSRISGLLIQARLYLAFFPAWAVLAAAGFDAIAGLQSAAVRFGRLLAVLVVAMLGLSLFSLTRDFVSRNPGLYILRLEDEKSYLYRSMGAYATAMEQVNSLPYSSRVLMLWEARGYYCQPRCNSDEVIDRWFDDARLHATPQAVVRAWREQGYTELLVYNLGRDFVQANNYPQEQRMHWSVLDATLATLRVEKQIGDGAYTLYRLP